MNRTALFLLLLPALAVPAAATVQPAPRPGDAYPAIRSGNQTLLRQWIAAGWDVNAADERGNTPLLDAAAVGNAATVRLLLDAGAKVNAANNLGMTPLLVGAPEPAKVKFLLDAGADVNAASGMGRTPVIVAASVPGNTAAVAMLLAKGANWKAADKLGMNALMAAAHANNLDAVRLLVAKGAEVTYAPPKFGTALHGAAINQNVAMARYLLSRGARVDATADYSHPVKAGLIALDRLTPLMFAVAYGPVDMVRLLLDAGADVNARDIRGMTPLMLAVASEQQDPAIVKLLLGRGARRDDRSAAGETALDWARKFNRRAVLALFGAQSAPVRAMSTELAVVSDREAIERGVKILETSQTAFFRQSGCVGCHNGVTTAMAVKQARARVATSHAAAAEFTQALMGQSGAFAPMVAQMIDPPGAIDSALYPLMGMRAMDVEPGRATDAFAVYTLRHHRQGQWFGGGIARSPLSEGSLQRTAFALQALNRYLPPAMREEFGAVKRQSLTWLMQAPVRTTDDAAMKVMALHAAGAPAVSVAQAARALTRLQHADGGFSANPEMAADAYATGEALVALASTGQAVQHADVARRGAEWLRRTQQADGSWHVRSRSAKFQPYFDAGFPHGHDQWLSNAATGWAVAALAMNE
ncbi:MAG: ankyrin repeat domain-containing protein [Bryobacterales bacterium]|nr:ankyrin repeat domain-containing protein [Bryobacterales bacterium]